MLGSDYDGERASAARLATIELKRLGLTWIELIKRAFQNPPAHEPKREQQQAAWYQQAAAAATAAQARQQRFWEEQLRKAREETQRVREQMYAAAQERMAEQEARAPIWTGTYQGIRLWEALQEINEHRDELNDFELRFVDSMLQYGQRVKGSEAQWGVIMRTLARLRNRDAA